jgi:hypothetical protein
MTEIARARTDARRAGVLYLLMGLIAPIGLLYVPGRLIVTGDAAATADRLRASEWVLRLGIASELSHQIIGIFLLLVLYRLFKGVSEYQATLLVILGLLLSLPIVFVNVLNEIAALILAGGSTFLSVFDRPQRDALAYLFLRLHGQGLQVAAIFWGLWLFPFGILVIRSRFIPRTLGVLLMVAGCAYVAASFTSLVMPRYANAVLPVAGILEIGELPIIFWLLIWGAKAQPVRVPAPVPAT